MLLNILEALILELEINLMIPKILQRVFMIIEVEFI